MKYKKNINSFITLIKVVIEFNDKLYKKIMKKRYDVPREKIDIYIKHFNNRSK